MPPFIYFYMFVAILVNMYHSNKGFYWNMNTDPIIEKVLPNCDGARVGIGCSIIS